MTKVLPVLRVFDYARTLEFYVDWLGFTIDWEYAPEGQPFYLQASLREVSVHLSQHHGECSPGALVILEDFEGLPAYHASLLAKNYRFMKPGLDPREWDPDVLTMTVIDPFYNHLEFTERRA